jgi:hypothetical protein
MRKFFLQVRKNPQSPDVFAVAMQPQSAPQAAILSLHSAFPQL